MQIFRQDAKRSFINLSPDERINLKTRLYWQAYGAGVEKQYTAMQLVALFLNQHHYVISGECAAGARRYSQEIMNA